MKYNDDDVKEGIMWIMGMGYKVPIERQWITHDRGGFQSVYAIKKKMIQWLDEKCKNNYQFGKPRQFASFFRLVRSTRKNNWPYFILPGYEDLGLGGDLGFVRFTFKEDAVLFKTKWSGM